MNPTNGQILKNYSYLTDDIIEEKIRQSQNHYNRYKTKPIFERSDYLFRIAKALKNFKSQLAHQMTLEIGKPFKDGIAEVEKSASAFEYYANIMGQCLSPRYLNSSYKKTKLIYKPLGPVLAIMPWNYPVWQVARAVAPNLAIGNIVFFKHSELTAGTAELLAEVFDSVGYEEDLKTVWNFCINHQQTARLIEDSRVQGVTLTGSALAGSQVGALAGRAIKKSVLELGGCDPYIVMADAPLSLAAEKCAISRLTNNGQSCISAKRFIVDQRVFDSFMDKFIAVLRRSRIGNPLLEEVDLGPLASKKFQFQLHEQVMGLKKEGAQSLLGDVPDLQIESSYFEPMVLKCNAQIWDRNKDLELFGPVAEVVTFRTEEEMLSMANSSIFGLGAALFTQDHEKATWLMENCLESGMVVLNDFLKSDPRVPFGGIKKSGYGRELGELGLLEFANIKVCHEGSL